MQLEPQHETGARRVAALPSVQDAAEWMAIGPQMALGVCDVAHLAQTWDVLPACKPPCLG